MSEELIDPMGLLKEEMANEEIIYKVSAIHHLSTIVLAIGPAQTQKTLLPFLECNSYIIIALIKNEDDEVLFAIAEELGIISENFENKMALLPLLEILCSADETVVRDQAVKSLSKISIALSDDDIDEKFAQMVLRLSSMATLP